MKKKNWLIPRLLGGATAFMVLYAPFTHGQAYIPSEKAKVFIGGVEVLSKKQMMRNTMSEDLPEELKSTRTRMAIENRQRISIYDHSPSRGEEDAPITFVEFNDLSCIQCQSVSKSLDQMMAKYPKKIRHIYVHTPIDTYNTTNPAAFYGRIAYNNNLFWNYRNSLYTQQEHSENIFVDKLITIGLDMKTIRKDIRDFSRKFYREIDADTQLASKMGETVAPVAYINGIRIGNSISMDQIELLIQYEFEQYEKRQ